MHFKALALCFSLLAATAIAAPTPVLYKRQDGASVLTLQSYNDFQISSGTAGDAQAKAEALLAPLPSDLSTVSAQDLDTIQTMRESAENAETEAFNPAIASASGATATALENGKIQNKVLKLTLEVKGLQIQAAQGADKADAITVEQGKLSKNIALDQKAAGQASSAVSFSG